MPARHDPVLDLGDEQRVVDGVGEKLAARGGSFTRHLAAPPFLAPYLERDLDAVADAGGVERGADDLVADAREVLHTAPTHEHDRVLLEVVADAWDVCGDLDPRGEADTCDLAERGVRLLGSGRVHTGAHAACAAATP